MQYSTQRVVPNLSCLTSESKNSQLVSSSASSFQCSFETHYLCASGFKADNSKAELLNVLVIKYITKTLELQQNSLLWDLFPTIRRSTSGSGSSSVSEEGFFCPAKFIV